MERKYAIVDIETTGGVLKRDKIIEFAVAIHDGREIIEQFQTLVDPGRSLPGNISMLTGITNEMLVDQPRFFEIARQIVEMTEGCIFVAHNVRFDYSFVKEAFRRLGYTYTRKQLCTVRLSRMMLPELPKHNLDALCRYYQIPVKNRHRAMDDVLATSTVFSSLLQKKEGKEKVEDLINYGIKAARLPNTISLEQLHDLPESCGVYYFYNRYQEVIYVGKSINIKKRVMQHFAENSAKSIKLQQRVHDISYTCTGSELVALLLEEKEIKRLQPEVNRALRKKLFPFALYYFYDSDGYLHIKAEKIKKFTPKGYTIIKEYPKLAYARGHLEGLIEEFELCQHRCGDKTGVGSCFNTKIDKCHGACIGTEPPGSYNERAMEAISYLQREIKDNFFIIDRGRETEEKSVVLVEAGRFRGFGYVSEGTVITGAEGLKDNVKKMPHSRDAQRIIHWYMKEKKMEKIIYF